MGKQENSKIYGQRFQQLNREKRQFIRIFFLEEYPHLNLYQIKIQNDMINKQDPRYREAKKKVEKIKDFYGKVLTYIVVIGFLAGLNYYTNQWSYMWFLWAAFGWGLGLSIKALKVFNLFPFLNKNWEEKKLKHFLEKEDFK